MELFSILIILSTLFTTKPDCSLSSIQVWPAGNTIKENSLMVIEGYRFGSKIITQLNQKYPVYLQSGEDRVELKVKELINTEGGVTQAILSPMTPLIEGNNYQLFIDSISNYEKPSINNWNMKTNKYEFPVWNVIKGRDIEKPRWKSKPKEVKKTYIQYGCGPEYYVYFDFQALDQSDILIRTSVTSIQSHKTNIGYLIPDAEGVLKVGHGMCGGEFTFEDGDHYEVTFDIMDASGNVTVWNGNKISFTKPFAPN